MVDHAQQSPEPHKYAADIAACRNGQQRSAKSPQHRWKHEIQIAHLRRTAVMTRAVFPHTSARADWLLAGLIDSVTIHWVRAPLLDGGDDEDADAGTDTTIPDDDNEDIASFTSQNKPQPSRPQTCDRCLRVASWGCLFSDVSALHGARSPLRRPIRMLWRHHQLPRPRRAGSTTAYRPTAC